MQIVKIPINKITPSIYQTRKNFGDIEELAQSIYERGLLNPISVRPLNGFGLVRTGWENGWELIAGERRWRAVCHLCKNMPLLDDTISAIVLDVDDQTAAELCVLENMHRSNLQPLEEAEGVAQLLKRGHDIEEVAKRVGRSVRWVRRRVQLLELSPKMRSAIADSENNWCNAPIESLELIAALPVEMQDTWFGDYCDVVSLDMTRNTIADMMRELKTAPFSLNDCLSCIKRTGCQPDLFEGEETSELGRCIDGACWNEKHKKSLTALVNDLRSKDANALVLADGYFTANISGVSQHHHLKECKPNDEDAMKAHIIDLQGNVKDAWFKRPSEEVTHDITPERKMPTAENKRQAAFCREMQEMIDDGSNPFIELSTDRILATLAVIGTTWAYSHPTSNPSFQNIAEWTTKLARERLWKECRRTLSSRIRYTTVTDCGKYYQEAVAIAKFIYLMSDLEIAELEKKSDE